MKNKSLKKDLPCGSKVTWTVSPIGRSEKWGGSVGPMRTVSNTTNGTWHTESESVTESLMCGGYYALCRVLTGTLSDGTITHILQMRSSLRGEDLLMGIDGTTWTQKAVQKRREEKCGRSWLYVWAFGLQAPLSLPFNTPNPDTWALDSLWAQGRGFLSFTSKPIPKDQETSLQNTKPVCPCHGAGETQGDFRLQEGPELRRKEAGAWTVWELWPWRWHCPSGWPCPFLEIWISDSICPKSLLPGPRLCTGYFPPWSPPWIPTASLKWATCCRFSLGCPLAPRWYHRAVAILRVTEIHSFWTLCHIPLCEIFIF